MATRKLSAFGQAFKEARERGDTEFEFNGKKYHTRRADEGSAPAAKPAPKAEAAPQAKAAPAAEATSEEPRRKTVFPSGSLVGRISMSQGAESTFPEPTETPTGRAPSEGSKLMRNLGKYFGSEETRKRLREEDEMAGLAKGGKVASASRRADGIAQRGKTRGRMV